MGQKIVAIKVLLSFVTPFYFRAVVVRRDSFLHPVRMCMGSNLAVLWGNSNILVQFQGGSYRHNGKGGNGVLFYF